MGKKIISVEILLYAICNTLSEIAKVDERVRRIIENWDTEIQFKVQPDGPSAYLQIERGRIIFYKGEINNPDLKMTFSSAEKAYDFFTRRSLLPLFGIAFKNIRHPILFLQTLRLLLFAGEYLSPSKGIVSAGS
ncbi:MAG: hypothetical protein A3I04_02570 [Nitrospinae bacterium RIFCSPLOWO2_02_FULL_39_110]|nr:MAG: hypothetical protein A2W53_01770 [Nitrospinae bacterium RIFCSPHIGHO2_02_39_11]OGV98751.1 MAG: hypothetical protein A3D97_05520 [Nitrospinae bacterium RIFCSPHIGHO2_12_FULL_39_42]OGW00180.1 MAG: hypothetical protein A3D20_07025 [Nitrospinae bacterium RIFCSPHIGHO2_02_FULL_39_82]OGW04348.1 MAG: hypothetical protein A3I04_02570 [Nitrospinae bacterium RIFCSPLOWO2_02_FULL_39_110]OGW07136.1 MAG: hypothetical protein A2Z59_09130 [Nitrospinae bacterium RIFCSPLOWO2_02_39_17]OGW09497.1 MAG: hypoth